MNTIVERLLRAERVEAFLSAVGENYRLSHEQIGDAITIPVPPDEEVFLAFGTAPKTEAEIVAQALRQILSLEYDLNDLTSELSAIYEEITLLYRLGEAFSGILKTQQIQQSSLEEISTVLGVAKAGILMLNEAQDGLVLSAGIGIAASKIGKLRFGKDHGLAWKVVRDRLSLIANTPSAFPEYLSSRGGEKPLLMVPLPSKKGIIGVLAVSDRQEEDEFTSKDEKLLSAIARQMAGMLENAGLYKETQELFLNTIEALSAAIDAKDPYTHGHSRRVTDFSVAIAEEMGLSFEEIENIRVSALLHDIGKLGVSELILRKPADLTNEEFAQIKRHPSVGAEIMSHVKKLSRFLPGMIDHHEKFSGGGYPKGTSCDQISLAGRIIAVADTFDAMTSDRPYHENCKGKPDEVALAELKRCIGTHFDPTVVASFISAYNKGKINK